MRYAAVLLFSYLMIPCREGQAQQFPALAGSLYGAAVNTYSQPAASANLPYRWDLEVAGAGVFWNNNIFSYALTRWDWGRDSLGPNGHFIPGDRKRWASLRGDVHLVNLLVRLRRHPDWVVGAGWNFHSVTWPGPLDFNYADSVRSMQDFMRMNAFNRLQRASLVDQQWTEWYLTAARILSDNRQARVTVGATLKLIKGISAAVVDVKGLSVGYDSQTGKELVFTTAAGRFGYSANLAEFGDDEGFGDAAGTLLSGAPLSPGLDLGMTYTRKRQAVIAGFRWDDPAAYDWKLEISLTDIGRAKYPLGDLSSVITGLQGHPEVERVARMMDSVQTLNGVKDSLAQVAVLAPWAGSVSISLPTALRINVDKSFGSHLFVNAQLALDMSFLNPGVDYRVHQLSYLAVTPRWETQRFGVYAPLYVNAHGSIMAGAAVRLGPLIAGVHDFRWLSHATPSGGGYIALVIRSLYRDKTECPVF